jgi:hypothetical protein
MKAAPTLSLIHDLASLNPYRHPLQTGGGPTERDHCAFCDSPMHTLHDPSCLWLRAVVLFGDLVPREEYRADDYR